MSRSKRCVFLGYPHAKKACKLYDLECQVIFNSQDVIFHEHLFQFHAPSPLPLSSSPMSHEGIVICEDAKYEDV